MCNLLTGFAGMLIEGAFCLIALSETRPGALNDRSKIDLRFDAGLMRQVLRN